MDWLLYILAMTMELNKKLKNFIENSGQDLNECLLYLFSIKYGLKYRVSEETFQFLEKSKIIELDFTTNSIILLMGLYEGEIVNLPEIDLTVEQDIRDRVDEYRSLFKNVRSGSIGVKAKVIQLLIQFCKLNNKTFDEVLEATKVYMSYTDFHLISNADNFISKLDKDGNEISLLKMAIEEQDMSSDTDVRTYKVI